MAAELKQSPTVRISVAAHRTLRELAATSHEPMQTVLDKALEQYRRQCFFEEMDASYTAIQADAEALAEEQKERTLWDVTLMDGLDQNERWHEDCSVTIRGAQNG